MQRTRKLAATAVAALAGVVLIQPAASAGPVGSGWTEHSPAWNVQIQSKGVITSYPSSTNSATGPGGSYARAGGVQTFKLFNNGSNRVEVRVQDNYRTGQRQFEGEVKVTAGTDDESAMQIFGNDGDGATTLMIRSYAKNGGTLRGGGKDLISGIYGKWVHVNVTHNATASGGSYSIYINGKLVHTANGPAGDHYFKYGVYGTLQNSGAEHQWRNVHFYRK
ncbi:hypothetical protein SAMN05421504_101190 [Amycolatopsis xylanica]|uniref:Alginate lyase 2 domain-containing protein n=1 Tax=Amycolatopsis xylanica TaxID=589385 RepID=A0A1H2SDT6_9PSEU|nr:polysaccharide lyase family 7 protein [Amycolatopsis xylanica]SDW29677.1 hypothetical protein SAMN05421504_101190 [Amycolatopsis xylanica]